MYLLCLGDIVSGHTFIGPFASYNEADNYYIDQYEASYELYHIVEITPPIAEIEEASSIPLIELNEEKSSSNLDLIEVSLLKEYGYSVGHSSSYTTSERQKILQDFYSAEYSTSVPNKLKLEWGEANSVQRLERMASNINGNISLRYAQRNARDSYKYAMSQWYEDLGFLNNLSYTKYRRNLLGSIPRQEIVNFITKNR